MLAPARIIERKRDGNELTREQIRGFIKGIQTGEVTDYQASALMMAIYFKGLSLNETVALTEAMLESGDRYDLSKVPGFKVDKHSTGGVGDKVSLILAPLAAACGLKVPMMSGRGLGHSGGTLDKLESITGFNVFLDRHRFEKVLGDVGCAMIGQSSTIVPADKKLYAIRDVTGTVECIPLIVASILSKKLAEGTQALVLDVKVGSGAFMKTRDQAKKLAKTSIQVAQKMGLKCRAVLTNMNQPLGYAAGNAIEVMESIEVLKNERCPKPFGEIPEGSSSDLKELTIQLCAHMLDLSRTVRNLAEARKLAHAKLADGSAWRVFQELVKAQGGELEQILEPCKLPHTARSVVWKSRKRGFLAKMDTQAIGQILVELGGGRKRASDSIDPRVGMIFHKKPGSQLRVGDPIVTVSLPEKYADADRIEQAFFESIEISGTRKPVPKLIFEVIG